MPSNTDEDRNNWIPLVTATIGLCVFFGVLLAFFGQESQLIPRILVVGWGLFLLYFVWRIARGVEHLAYRS